jgi:excisionase family DNA binding protein
MHRKRRKKKTMQRTVTVPAKPPGARRVARTNEAAAYGHFSRRTLFRLIDSKKIKAYRYSARLVLVDLDSIDAFQNSLPELTHADG